MDNDILHRVRVLDFTTTIAGPHCTRLLADLGADVVKIEAPDGELMRTRPPLRDGASSYFGQLNAGKRSLVLDLKQPAAVEIVKRLVGDADLVVENFRPGVMKRLGLDYESLRAVRPDLVFCAMSGYGQTGPSAGLPAYAPVIHAASGYDLAHLSYQDGRTRPDNNGVFIADVLTGTYAFGAIAAALYHRRVTGQGQMVDVSMLESMLTMTLAEVQRAQFAMAPPGRPMFGPLQTRDGYLMLAVASERTFQDLARAAGRPDWIDRPALRRVRGPPAATGTCSWTSSSTGHDSSPPTSAQAAFERFGVPSSRYRTVEEAMADAQLAHREAFTEVRDAAGAFRTLNPPFRFSDAPAAARPFAARLGEHSDAVLAEAGYTPDEIDAFRKAGAIG